MLGLSSTQVVKIQKWMHNKHADIPPEFAERSFSVRGIRQQNASSLVAGDMDLSGDGLVGACLPGTGYWILVNFRVTYGGCSDTFAKPAFPLPGRVYCMLSGINGATNEAITLGFHGPFSWMGTGNTESVHESMLARNAGIYLWTIEVQDGHLVYYVGETGRSFAARLREHLRDQLAGLYHIHAPTQFARGEKSMLWPGIYDKHTPGRLEDYVDRLPDLVAPLCSFIRMMRFHLAPIETNPRLRKRIEAALSDCFLSQPGRIGDFQESGVRYHRRRPDEPPIRIQLLSNVPILGLPDQTFA